MTFLAEGFLFSAVPLLLLLVFEFGFSYSEIAEIQKRDCEKKLHIAGIRATELNDLIYGPIGYALAIQYFCTNDHQRMYLWQQAFAVLKFMDREWIVTRISTRCIGSTTSIMILYCLVLQVPYRLPNSYLRI